MLKKLAVFIPIFLCALNLCAAQTEPAHTGSPSKDGIEFVITDFSGAVIQGANSTVLDASGDVVAKNSTDDYGRIRVSNLASGKYTIKVEAPGFKPVQANFDVPRQLGSTISVTLRDPLPQTVYVGRPDVISYTEDNYRFESLPPRSLGDFSLIPLPVPQPPTPRTHRHHSRSAKVASKTNDTSRH